MGNFLWDDEYNDVCFTQHYNGRPLSVVLTEPFDPFEPQPTSFFDDIPYGESDFASLHHHHHHHHHQRQRRHRSRSSGRRYKREYFSMLNKSKLSLTSFLFSLITKIGVQQPNANYNSYCFSPPPPPPPRRPIHRVSSREVLIEKIGEINLSNQLVIKTNLFSLIETVTIEEQQRRPPTYMVSFIRTPSPPIRQLKIRTRPSSCFDLLKDSTGEN